VHLEKLSCCGHYLDKNIRETFGLNIFSGKNGSSIYSVAVRKPMTVVFFGMQYYSLKCKIKHQLVPL